MNDFSQEILKENIIFFIKQFQKYAIMSQIDRNNYVINTLKEILCEAEKYQTELTEWEKYNE